MDQYRVMVIGEDNTEFCYDNYLTEEEAKDTVAEAMAEYPESKILVEKHTELD